MKSKSVKTVKNISNQNAFKPEYAPVNLVRIFMAMLYDGLLLVPLAMLCSAIAILIHINLYGPPPVQTRIIWSVTEGVFFSVGLVIVLTSYFVYCWCRKGQTLGMKTWRIKVIDANSYQLLSVRAATIRAGVAVISLVLLGLGFWSRWRQPQKRTWHDLASQSQIILLKKN